MKIWYCVTSSFDNRGRVTAAITGTVEAAEQPKQGYKSTRTKDIYVDYFGSHKEAAAFVEEAKRA